MPATNNTHAFYEADVQPGLGTAKENAYETIKSERVLVAAKPD